MLGLTISLKLKKQIVILRFFEGDNLRLTDGLRLAQTDNEG